MTDFRDEINAYWNNLPYTELRKNEYPELGEQLDAILKGFNQMRLNGESLPDDLDNIINQWLAVKAKYPKE